MLKSIRIVKGLMKENLTKDDWHKAVKKYSVRLYECAEGESDDLDGDSASPQKDFMALNLETEGD